MRLFNYLSDLERVQNGVVVPSLTARSRVQLRPEIHVFRKCRFLCSCPTYTHTDSSYFQKLTELTLMHDGTKVSPKHLSELVANLPCLTYLDLSEGASNDQVVSAIATSGSRLRTLKLRCCPITDAALFALCLRRGGGDAPCPELQTLDIRGTAVGKNAVAMVIDKLTKLRHLLHDDIVRPLAVLHADDPLVPETTHRLQSMSGYFLPDLPLRESPHQLFKKLTAYCPNLTSINFVNLCDDASLLCFRRHRLRSITLAAFRDESAVTFVGGISPLLSQCGPWVESLSLSEIDDIDIGTIGLLCPELRNLKVHLYDLPEFTVHYQQGREGQRPVFLKLEDLELARSDACRHSSFSSALTHLLSSATKLRHLSFTCLHELNDLVVASVMAVNSLRFLQTLHMNECNTISYQAVLEIILASDHLHTVKLMKCKEIYRRDYDSLVRFIKDNYYDLDVTWT